MINNINKLPETQFIKLFANIFENSQFIAEDLYRKKGEGFNDFEDLIKKHSNENDTILDTFLGSGTTAIACKNTNRAFKGCEISNEYYDKIIQSME